MGALAGAADITGPAYLTLRIVYLGRLLEKQGTRQLSELGLTLAEWRVLGQMAHAGPLTVRALAERSCVDRAETSRAAASLVSRGYLSRRNDPDDARSPLFRCTTTGRALYRKVFPLRRRFQSRLAARMSRSELRTLLSILERLIDDVLEQERRSTAAR